MRHDPNVQRNAIIALARDWHAPTGPCPKDDALVHWHEREEAARAQDGITEHIASCARCYDRWQTLLEVLPVCDAARARSEKSLRHRWFGWLNERRLAALAAATSAAVIGFLFLPPAPSALPGYQLRASGDTMMRGTLQAANARSVAVTAGERVELLLTPSQRYADGLDAAVWFSGGSDVVPLAGAQIQISDAGAVRINAPARAGTWHVVIAPDGALPSHAELTHALATATAPATREWQRHSINVTLRERPQP